MTGRRIDTYNAVVVVAMTFFFSEVAETGALAVPVPVANAGAFVGKIDGTTNRYRYR